MLDGDASAADAADGVGGVDGAERLRQIAAATAAASLPVALAGAASRSAERRHAVGEPVVVEPAGEPRDRLQRLDRLGRRADDGGLIRSTWRPITHSLMMEPSDDADGRDVRANGRRGVARDHDFAAHRRGAPCEARRSSPTRAASRYELLEAHPVLTRYARSPRPSGPRLVRRPCRRPDGASPRRQKRERAALRRLLGELLGAHEPDDDEAARGAPAVVGDLDAPPASRMGPMSPKIELAAVKHRDAPAALDVLLRRRLVSNATIRPSSPAGAASTRRPRR